MILLFSDKNYAKTGLFIFRSEKYVSRSGSVKYNQHFTDPLSALANAGLLVMSSLSFVLCPFSGNGNRENQHSYPVAV